MESESGIMKKIMLEACSLGSRLFRNNVGLGFIGRSRSPVKFGLCVGSSDLIGWHTVTITEEMVGRRVSIFVACEVKSSKGRVTPEQKAFLKAVQGAGGIAVLARSIEDYEFVLRNWAGSLRSPPTQKDATGDGINHESGDG